MKNRIQQVKWAILAFCLIPLVMGCGMSVERPGPAELAALAESVGETIVVFLPSTAHSKLATWKPEVQYLHDKLELGEPVTGDWVKEVVADKLGYFLFNLLEDEDLTDAQRQAIINDFNRSMKLIKIGGSWELDPDKATIAYGAVTGILNGMNLLGI